MEGYISLILKFYYKLKCNSIILQSLPTVTREHLLKGSATLMPHADSVAKIYLKCTISVDKFITDPKNTTVYVSSASVFMNFPVMRSRVIFLLILYNLRCKFVK